MKKVQYLFIGISAILFSLKMHAQEGGFFSKIKPNAYGLELGLNKSKGNYTQQFSFNGTSYLIQPSGKVGLDININAYRFTNKETIKKYLKPISYIDLGLGVFTLSGKEDVSISVNKKTSDFSTADFNLLYLSGRLSIHNFYHLKGTKLYLDNGIGGNMNYRIKIQSENYQIISEQYPNNRVGQHRNFPLGIQLYYNFGVGYALNEKNYIIPTIKLPIFGLHRTLDDFKPTTQWFSAFYTPVTLSLKYIYKL